MKIHSKFQDYYDSSLSTGLDESRLYLRSNSTWERSTTHVKSKITQHWNLSNPTKEKDIQVPSSLLTLHTKLYDETTAFSASLLGYRKPNSKNDPYLSITPFYVIVGGNVHKGVWVSKFEKSKENTLLYTHTFEASICPLGDPDLQRTRTDIVKNSIICPITNKILANVLFNGAIYSAKTLDELVPQNWKDKKFYHDERARYPSDYINWLNNAEQTDKLYHNLMDDKIITAVINHKQIIQNPRLTDWQFFKKQDPNSCFQEISMFLENMSAPDRVPVVIEDKYRIEQHGFDKQSFRKAPTKNAVPKLPKRPYP